MTTKHLFALTLSVGLALPSFAQTPSTGSEDGEVIEFIGKGRNYDGTDRPDHIVMPKANKYANVENSVRNQLIAMARCTGFSLNISFKATTSFSSAASGLVKGWNSRIVLFNPKFLKQISGSSDEFQSWAVKSVIAHEVGHHMQNNVFGIGDSFGPLEDELACDRYSGWVLARMGATLKEAQSAMAQMPEQSADSEHPSRQKRLDAIKDGYVYSWYQTLVMAKIHLKTAGVEEQLKEELKVDGELTAQSFNEWFNREKRSL